MKSYNLYTLFQLDVIVKPTIFYLRLQLNQFIETWKIARQEKTYSVLSSII